MPFDPQNPGMPTAGLSRRRLITGLLAATLAPVLAAPRRSSAQTPMASPTGEMPNTLAQDVSPQFRAVAEALMEAMAATGTPGGALGIYADGREEHAAFGVENIESGVLVTPETLFQMGSVNKTFTGTAAMRLVEDGAIDLDATVRTYLPDFTLEDDAVAEQVTIRHLLTHTGGWWGDLFVDTGSGEDAIEQYIAEWFPQLPQLAPLGDYFSYNNAGFILLGRLIEEATGQDYRTALLDLVLDPLALPNTLFTPDAVNARPHAQGHLIENGEARIQEPLYFPRAIDPAGGLWSTTPDLIRYARFHLGDGTAGGERILTPESLTLMQTVQQPIPYGSGLAMALPWFIVDVPGQRFVLHEGGTFGQHAQLWLAPERDFAISMFVNGIPGGAVAVQAALAEMLAQFFGLGADAAQMATPSATPVAASSVAATPLATPLPANLEEYAGRYELPDSTSELRVRDGSLVFTYELHPLPEQIQLQVMPEMPSEVTLEFVAPDVALVTVSGLTLPVIFVRRDDGSVGWMASALRLVPKVDTA